MKRATLKEFRNGTWIVGTVEEKKEKKEKKMKQHKQNCISKPCLATDKARKKEREK